VQKDGLPRGLKKVLEKFLKSYGVFNTSDDSLSKKRTRFIEGWLSICPGKGDYNPFTMRIK
jgi:hypothetical protein